MSRHYDLIIRGGQVADGTGAQPQLADIAVKQGIILAVRRIEGTAREEIDAAGLLVTPGFIDLHTHYDSSVFTNDPERAYAVGRRLRARTVGHNGFKSEFGIAFGGFKQSGIGREGGIEGLHPYLESKTMIFEAAPMPAR